MIAWSSTALVGIAGAPIAPIAGAQEPQGTPLDLEAVARAQVAAEDLADTLRSVEESLQSREPVAATPEALTKEDNDQLVETATKDQLARMADELDQLSAALASGAAPELTQTLVQSLSRRAAAVSELGTRTDRPLIPTEQMEALRDLWSDVQALAEDRSVTVDGRAP